MSNENKGTLNSKVLKWAGGLLLVFVIIGVIGSTSQKTVEAPQTIAETQMVTQTPKVNTKPVAKPAATTLHANGDDFKVVWKEWPVGFEKKINTAVKNKDCAALDDLEKIALEKGSAEYAYRPDTPRGTRGLSAYIGAKARGAEELNCVFVVSKGKVLGWQHS